LYRYDSWYTYVFFEVQDTEQHCRRTFVTNDVFVRWYRFSRERIPSSRRTCNMINMLQEAFSTTRVGVMRGRLKIPPQVQQLRPTSQLRSTRSKPYGRTAYRQGWWPSKGIKKFKTRLKIQKQRDNSPRIFYSLVRCSNCDLNFHFALK